MTVSRQELAHLALTAKRSYVGVTEEEANAAVNALADLVRECHEVPDVPENLERALALVERIERMRAIQRELRSAFARSELDGGAKAAPDHPLYRDAEAELERLHAALMILI